MGSGSGHTVFRGGSGELLDAITRARTITEFVTRVGEPAPAVT
jgi:hypothetical protein